MEIGTSFPAIPTIRKLRRRGGHLFHIAALGGGHLFGEGHLLGHGHLFEEMQYLFPHTYKKIKCVSMWDHLLLSNCAKKSTNNTWIECKYLVILYSYLESWIFCIVKNLFNQSAAHATLLYPLCFSCLIRNEQKDLAEKKAVG